MNKLSGLHPQIRQAAEWCLQVARHFSVPVTVTSVYRSFEEQERLRLRWESGLSRWPANRPGDSAHNYGLAWDSSVPDWAQRWWDEVRRYAGWHVPRNDEIHAALPDWRRYV